MKEYHCSPGNAEGEENIEIYNEWKSRRPWKERKRMAKAMENIDSKIVSQIQDPELIFYGRHSGVVGLSTHDIYKHFNDLDILQFGYDKVRFRSYQLSHVSVFIYGLFLAKRKFYLIREEYIRASLKPLKTSWANPRKIVPLKENVYLWFTFCNFHITILSIQYLSLFC